MTNERNRLYDTVLRAKEAFDKCCDQVQLTSQKHDRAPDPKSRDKLKRIWHQEILDMNNSKVYSSHVKRDIE